MALREEFETLRDHLRRFGWRPTFRRGVEVLRERIVRPWERLYWLPATEVARVDPPDEDARLRVVHQVDELEAEAWVELERQVGSHSAGLYRARIDQGCEMHLLELGGRIAGSRFVIWGSRHPFQNVLLTDRDTMGIDVRIDRAFRGRKLAPLFFSMSIRDLAERGCDRVFAAVAVHNVRSIRTLERVGFRHLLNFRVERGRYRFDRSVIP